MAFQKWFGRRGRTSPSKVAGSRRRLRIAHVLMVLLLVVATGKLVHVQAFEASALSKQSEKQRITKEAIPAERGSITDRNGAALALTGESEQLYANPSLLTEELREQHAQDPSEPTPEQYKREIARYIPKVVGGRISEKEVREALFKDAKFTYFGSPIEPSQARQITQKYPQIGSEHRATREYPAGKVGADVVGGANWRMDERKIRGLIGLESALNTKLSGTDGEQVAETARDSSEVYIPGSQHQLKPAVPGSDFQLTLDSDLQFVVQQKLADYVHRTQAKSGSAVVLDAKTGEVHAMANDKTFNPNAAEWNNLGNPAVSAPFEPGSVNKVITAAGAIEDGVLRPDSVMQVPGEIDVADRTIGDAWEHGKIPLTFTGVLAKSSNVGTIKAAKKLGPGRFNDLARRFGLGQRTGIELPGESPGTLPPKEEWSGSTFANLPIGQGLSMTALQMTSMYQAIANDGVRVPPRVIKSETRPDGTTVPRKRPDGVRVVSPDTAKTVRNMLRAVVQDDPQQQGTGPDAAIPGYQVAGKTGTAQQVDPDCNCYSNSKYWITFAGMLPVDNPRYVVGIMLDAPTPGTHEASTAAPLFHDIGAYLAQRNDLPLERRPPPVQTLQPK